MRNAWNCLRASKQIKRSKTVFLQASLKSRKKAATSKPFLRKSKNLARRIRKAKPNLRKWKRKSRRLLKSFRIFRIPTWWAVVKKTITPFIILVKNRSSISLRKITSLWRKALDSSITSAPLKSAELALGFIRILALVWNGHYSIISLKTTLPMAMK